ncbi:uncharacterized protein UHOD_11049 [Ustilago sp. UG-2017b]|nr:uncharacterized protein UHOD_11049 [Ustilago sp. UG-2017b]
MTKVAKFRRSWLNNKRLPVPKPWDELVRAAEEVWNTQMTLEHINPVSQWSSGWRRCLLSMEVGSSISQLRDPLQSKALVSDLITVRFVQPDTYETSVVQAMEGMLPPFRSSPDAFHVEPFVEVLSDNDLLVSACLV